MSDLAATVVRDQPITDVFVDQPRLERRRAGGDQQYDKWIGAMAGCAADRAAIRQRSVRTSRR